MRRFKSTRERPTVNSQINITNLVDVALTVLTMFILVAPLIENGIAVSLPQASASKMDIRDAVNLKVAKDGAVYLGERKVGLSELGQKLRAMVAADARVPVNVLGDAGLVYQDFISVLDTVRRAGVVNIGLPTEVELKSKK
jgi:biopolymer transport protein ExbD